MVAERRPTGADPVLVVTPASATPAPGGGIRLSGTAESDGREAELHVDTDPDDVPDDLDNSWLLLATLPLAMRWGRNLRLAGRVDPWLLAGVDEFQRTMALWYPSDLARVRVSADHIEAGRAWPPPPWPALQAFSGGVDSTFSLLRHTIDGLSERQPVVDARFIVGFDVSRDDVTAQQRSEKAARAVVDSLGVRLGVARTNIREVFDDAGLDWGSHTHGIALAAVLHATRGAARLGLIPSTGDYWSLKSLIPWGSTAVTDPQLSSSRLRVAHDGADAPKVLKFRTVARNETAVRHLRVCFQPDSAGGNCGACWKCQETWLALVVSGCEDPPSIPTERASQLDELHRIYPAARHRVFEYRQLAVEQGRDALVSRIDRALLRSSW